MRRMAILGLGVTLYSAILLRFYLEILQEPRKREIKKTLCWLLFVLWQFCLNTQLIFFHPGINLVLTLATTISVSLGAYKSTLWKGTFISAIFVAVWMLLEGMSEIGFLYLTGGHNPPFLIVICSNLLLTVFVIVLYKKVQHKRECDSDGKILLTCIVLLGMTLYAANFMLVKNAKGYGYSYILLWTVTSALLLMNMAVYPMYSKLEDMFLVKKNINMYKRQMNLYKEQFATEKQSHQQLYRWQHDMKQQLLYLKELGKQGKREELLDQIEVLLGEATAESEIVLKTGNLMIDAIINHTYGKTIQENIHLYTEIKVKSKIGIKDEDLWILLGNLVDNAIEACHQVEIGKRDIWMDILQEKGAVNILVRNRFCGEVKADGQGGLISRKGEKHHGFGLYSIRRITEAYKGRQSGYKLVQGYL